MNIVEATKISYERGDVVMFNPVYMVPGRFVFVAGGKVYRDNQYLEWEPDAREVMSDAWEIRECDLTTYAKGCSNV